MSTSSNFLSSFIKQVRELNWVAEHFLSLLLNLVNNFTFLSSSLLLWQLIILFWFGQNWLYLVCLFQVCLLWSTLILHTCPNTYICSCRSSRAKLSYLLKLKFLVFARFRSCCPVAAGQSEDWVCGHGRIHGPGNRQVPGPCFVLPLPFSRKENFEQMQYTKNLPRDKQNICWNTLTIFRNNWFLWYLTNYGS